MTAMPLTPEEIIEAYKAAVQHAKGSLFASMLRVACDGGWFSVTDLEGTETRYRKKEIIAAINELLAQPKYEPAGEATVLAAPDATPAFNAHEQRAQPESGAAQTTHVSEAATRVETSDFGHAAATRQLTAIAAEADLANMAAAIGQSKELTFATTAAWSPPAGASVFRESERETEDAAAPAVGGLTFGDRLSTVDSVPGTNREREDKIYFRNLSRIFLAVGALIVLVVLFIVLRK